MEGVTVDCHHPECRVTFGRDFVRLRINDEGSVLESAYNPY